MISELINNFIQNANISWEKVDKKSCVAVVQYLIEHEQQSKEYGLVIPNLDEALNIFNKKIVLYLSAMFPKIQVYFNANIVNMENWKLHELFHAFLLPKRKMPAPSRFEITANPQKKIIVVKLTLASASEENKNITCFFDVINQVQLILKAMVLTNVKGEYLGLGDSKNPELDSKSEIEAKKILSQFVGYPEYSDIDIEFLDKIGNK